MVMLDSPGMLSLTQVTPVLWKPLTIDKAVWLFIGALGRVDGRGHFAPN